MASLLAFIRAWSKHSMNFACASPVLVYLVVRRREGSCARASLRKRSAALHAPVSVYEGKNEAYLLHA